MTDRENAELMADAGRFGAAAIAHMMACYDGHDSFDAAWHAESAVRIARLAWHNALLASATRSFCLPCIQVLGKELMTGFTIQPFGCDRCGRLAPLALAY